ncbi:uncharacterized protein LOC111693597 [Trichogramma pretiosum]|uniref:uncharacterized protein LOC111693597 n=1 Tax=Trichogramma pretiosum TaxID=7493 RepID=UPI000C71B645|nr:uncharacterized protein LOC111693597 [Trichogramma pretiosum]
MSKIILLLALLVAVAAATPQYPPNIIDFWRQQILEEATEKPVEKTCSPWKGPCHSYDDCCRNLLCLSYAAKCVPKFGLQIPGQDTRPLGPGPYPPYQG